MGNNAAAAAFAAEQERIQAEQLAAQLRAEPMTEAQKLFPTLSPEEAEQWNIDRMSIPASGSSTFGRLFDPIQQLNDNFAKLPGSPEAALKGLEAGFSGDASWNPYSKEASVWDIGAGGTELSQNENYRDIGRAIGTAIGGGFAAPALSGALGGGALGGAGAGAITGAVPAALQPGATWESVLKAAAVGGIAGGIKGYMSTDGTIKQLPSNLGDPLPTDFADIAYDPASAPITDFPGMTPEVPGVPSSPLGNFNPGNAFVGPPEFGYMPEGTPDLNFNPDPSVDTGAPPGQRIEVTGERLPSDGTSGFAPFPPMYTGSPGPIPETPAAPEVPEIKPNENKVPSSTPGPNYGKLLASLLGNLLSSGGGSGGGSRGGSDGFSADKLARSLRQPSEPVTMTNPNYIAR